MEEEPSVAFGEDARIKNGDHAAVGLGAYEPAGTLAKFDECVGQGEIVKGVAAVIADPLGFCLGNGMGRGIEG